METTFGNSWRNRFGGPRLDSRYSEAVMRYDMLLCAFWGCKIWHYMKYVHDMYVYIYILYIHHPSFSRLKKSMLDRSKWSGRVNPLALLQTLCKCVMLGNPLHNYGGSNYSSVTVKRLGVMSLGPLQSTGKAFPLQLHKCKKHQQQKHQKPYVTVTRH